jgi:hypothetical protein
MSTESTGKFQTPGGLYKAFLKAVVLDVTSALRVIGEYAFPDGPEAPPSPRAKALVEAGEWDAGDKLAMTSCPPEACMAGVGGKDRFCFVRNCTSASHQEPDRKLELEVGWYVRKGSLPASGAYVTPYLPSRAVPIAVTLILARDAPLRMTLGQWKFLCQDFFAGEEADMVLSEDEVPSDGDSLESISTSTRETPETPPAEDPVVPAAAVGPRTMELFLATATTDGDPSTSPFHVALGDQNPSVEAFLEGGGDEVRTAVLQLMSDVGPAVENQEQRWEQMMFRKTGDYVKQLEQLEAHMVWSTERIDTISQQVAEANDASNAWQTIAERTRRDLLATRNDLAKEREAGLKRAQGYESLEKSHDKLASDVLRRAVGGGVQFAEHVDFGTSFPTQQALLNQLDHQINSTGGDVDLLKCSIQTLQGQFESGGGVKCHGVDIGGYRECVAFYESGNLNIGGYLDGFAMAHAIKTTAVHEQDALRNREARKKVKFDNALEASVITSFDTPVPSILATPGKPAHAAISEHLKSFKDFKRPGRDTGVGQQIKAGCKAIVGRTSKLREIQGTEQAARGLSLGMASDARVFNEGFVRFMEELYDELTTDTTYSPQEAWEVCIDCADEIWRELSEVRAIYLDAACLSKGLYLWGMLQAWKVQQRYLANDFKNDPALTGIMVRRLLMHGGDTSVKDKLTKLDSLLTKVDEHHRLHAAQLKKVQDSLKFKADK